MARKELQVRMVRRARVVPLNALLGRGELGGPPHPLKAIVTSPQHPVRYDSKAYRHSIGGSRDLKDLNIDEDLLGSDDSTSEADSRTTGSKREEAERVAQ